MKKEILDYLLKQGCIVDDDGCMYTNKGDYVTLTTLDQESMVEFLYKHKLTNLQSLDTARGKASRTSISLGFNEEEQKWYGFTHRGYGAFGIGQEAKRWGAPGPDFICKTLDDCKNCAIAIAEWLD